MRGDLTNYLYTCKLILWDGENDGLKILKTEKAVPTKVTLKVGYCRGNVIYKLLISIYGVICRHGHFCLIESTLMILILTQSAEMVMNIPNFKTYSL